ncbi:MAG TPA: hypothetical protein VMG31_12020 [Verrucomicrobiae bacterium]|nr:hypothetical protein [Verrucomicrobiae bacterium]
MKTIFKKMTGILGLLAMGTLLAGVAAAQCGSMDLPQISGKYHKQSWKAVDGAARLLRVADGMDPIVGLWNVKFISEGNDGIPDGTVIDNSFTAWHSDGTEFNNSGLRSPASSAVCMGVWQNLGNGIYKLNHFGMSWDPSNTTAPIGPANIRENITLAKDGNAFSGKFTIDQYDSSGNLLAHLQGNIAAHRIDINTHARQVL